MAQQVLQQPQRIDDGYQNPQEEIPLHRLNSIEERDARSHLRNIFNRVCHVMSLWQQIEQRCEIHNSLIFFFLQFDSDADGFLSIPEMKNLIRQHQCEDIPKEVARQILQMHDEDMNGRLDFEEFYNLSQQHKWLVRGLLVRYCKMIVPSPHRPEQDEVGEKHKYF